MSGLFFRLIVTEESEEGSQPKIVPFITLLVKTLPVKLLLNLAPVTLNPCPLVHDSSTLGKGLCIHSNNSPHDFVNY